MNKIYKSLASAVAIICLSLAIWSCENNVAPTIETTTLKGVLADKQGNTVPFAIVNIYDISSGKTVIQADKLLAKDTTDEDGNYEVKNIPADFENLTLEAEHSDFSKYKVNLKDLKSEIKDNKLQTKLDNKSECGFSLNFTILDSTSKQALAGAQVRLNRDGKLIRKTNSNDQGNINFEGVCAGKYEFRLAREGYKTIESTVTIGGSDSITNLPILMRSMNETPPDSCCDGIAKLFIKDKDGKYIIGAKFKLSLNGKVIKDGSVTSNNEPITLDKLCEGKYRLVITAEGFNAIEMDVTVSCKEPVNVSKVMEKPSVDTCCDGIAKLFVKDKDGKYIVGAKYKLYLNGKVIKEGSITSNSEPLTLDKLCEGKYSISINADGYNGVETNLTVSCKEPVSVSKILEKKAADSCCDGIANIILKDENGNLIPNAKIKLVLNGKVIKEVVTNGKDIVNLLGLCEGKYRLLITADGYKGSESDLVISCKEPANVNKILVKPTSDSCCDGIVKIYAKDASGKMLLGATVKLMQNGQVVKSVVTNGTDPIIFSGLCQGPYKVLIAFEGYVAVDAEIQVSCEEPTTLIKILESNKKDSCCDGIAKLFIKDKDGKYIIGAKYKLSLNGKVIKDGSVSNSNEPVTLDKLCEGKYRLVITAEGYNAIEMDVNVSCKEPVNVSKVMGKPTTDSCCEGIAKIYAKDKESKYLVGAKFKLYLNGKAIKEGTFTSANEPITLDKLCEGKYSITISLDGYNSVEASFTVSCKEPVTLIKVLEKKTTDSCCDGIAKFYVKNSEGKIIVGAKIKVFKGSTLIKEATISSEYEPFVLNGLCEGDGYSVSFSADGFSGIETSFAVSCKEPVTISKSLTKKSTDSCCTSTLKFKIMDKATSQMISGATVKVMIDNTVIETGTTNGDGYWISSKVCNKTYKIVISASGYLDLTTSWVVPTPCGALQETFKLDK